MLVKSTLYQRISSNGCNLKESAVEILEYRSLKKITNNLEYLLKTDRNKLEKIQNYKS